MRLLFVSSLYHRMKNGLVETWTPVGIGSIAVGSYTIVWDHPEVGF